MIRRADSPVPALAGVDRTRAECRPAQGPQQLDGRCGCAERRFPLSQVLVGAEPALELTAPTSIQMNSPGPSVHSSAEPAPSSAISAGFHEEPASVTFAVRFTISPKRLTPARGMRAQQRTIPERQPV